MLFNMKNKNTFYSILITVLFSAVFSVNAQSNLTFKDLKLDIPINYELDSNHFYSKQGNLIFIVKNSSTSEYKIGVYQNQNLWYTTPVIDPALNIYDIEMNQAGIFVATKLDSLNHIYGPSSAGNKINLIRYNLGNWERWMDLAPSTQFSTAKLTTYQSDLYITIGTAVLRQVLTGTLNLFLERNLALNETGFSPVSTNHGIVFNGNYNQLKRPRLKSPVNKFDLYDTLKSTRGVFHISKLDNNNLLKLSGSAGKKLFLEGLDSSLIPYSIFTTFNDFNFTYSDSGYNKCRVYLFRKIPIVFNYLPGNEKIMYTDKNFAAWKTKLINQQFLNAIGSEGKIYGYNRITKSMAEIVDEQVVSGKLYLDFNNNCNFDNSSVDAQMKFRMIKFVASADTFIAISDTSGNYSLNLPNGNYKYYPNFKSNFNTNFCGDTVAVYKVTGHTKNIGVLFPTDADLEVKFETKSEMRYGDTIDLTIAVTNNSKTNYTGSLSCKLPNGFNYSGAHSQGYPVPTSFNNNTVNWTITELTFREPLILGFRFIIDINKTSINSYYLFNTKLKSGLKETDTLDNIDTLKVKLVAAYDPNNKLSNPSDISPLSTKKIKYKINFQNLGTSYARNVTIVDSVAQFCELSKIYIYGSSHRYTISATQNILTFNFPNIYLPSSESAGELSKGWIEFEVTLNSGLKEGTKIDNKAYIYFDYNPAIITNTASVILSKYATTKNTPKKPSIQNDLLVFPNPGNAYLIAHNSFSAKQIIKIYDITGKLVISKEIEANQNLEINTELLPTGVYIININGLKAKWIKT